MLIHWVLGAVVALVIGAAEARPAPTTQNNARSESEWPRIDIRDPATHEAAERALSGAATWLAAPACQRVLEEYSDPNGARLVDNLGRLGTTLEAYLRMVFFLDGGRHPTCRRDGIVAFTARGSRVVYLCGRDFERAWRRDAREMQATIIHEILHSLGLGENPPSPRSINERVKRLCWQ